MPSLPPSNLTHQWNAVRVHEATADGLVPGDIHPDAAEEWDLSLELKRQLGISYNTAWRLKHKRMQAMKEHDDSQPLSGNVQMDDACLGGERPGGKRGRGAAGKTPFSDGLSCFASVTTAGCTHEAIVTGGGPASVNQEAPGRGGIDPADTRAALLDILP